MCRQFQTQKFFSERHKIEVKLFDFNFLPYPHSLELFLTQIIHSWHEVDEILFFDEWRFVVKNNWGYRAHGLGLCVDKKNDVGCRVSVDSFGIIDELVDFANYYSLELEVEDEIDGIEDLMMGVEAFWWSVVELGLNSRFQNLFYHFRRQLLLQLTKVSLRLGHTNYESGIGWVTFRDCSLYLVFIIVWFIFWSFLF